MKIAQASIGMTSSHHWQIEGSRTESLRIWQGNERPPSLEVPPDQTVFDPPVPDRLTISMPVLLKQATTPPPCPVTPQSTDASLGMDPKLRTLILTLEALTGKKISAVTMQDFQPASPSVPIEMPAAQAAQPAEPAQAAQVGWGVAYDLRETRTEHEEMSFAAVGSITTEDGKDIDMNVQLAMQRDSTESREISIRAGDAARQAVDPLVINYAGAPADLTDTKFRFDLNADGLDEDISFVSPGSGFLTIDENGDGVVNNGRELFGPQTGNGFAELNQYDADGNGWLDENDPIFAKLRIWAKDGAGKDLLLSLKDQNIGALFLREAATTFRLTDDANNPLGAIRSSSVFVREDGSAGILHDIDLNV